MIKVLQKKFIFAAMLAITILLVVLLGAINVFNFTSSQQDINEALENIVSSAQTGSQSSAPGGPFEGFSLFSSDSSLNPDDSFAADDVAYFTVTLDTSGNALLVEMNGISSISQDEAVEMAQLVFDSKRVSGSEGDFKFMGYTSLNSSGITYVFMDTGYFKSGVIRVVSLSVLAGCTCWLFMLALVVFLSKRFIKPIAENMQKQKAFISDAGHEIKTPIAIIQANTEAMELFNGENKWSRNIKEQTVRLTSLVTNLLTLSKASETYEKPVSYDIDLSDVAGSGVEMFKEPAAVKGKLINFEPGGPVMVKGDKEQFSRIVSLLLDNAVKYAPPMSEIDVKIIENQKTAVLKITNDCEELPGCEPERLFDRFYRPDSSHNSSTGGNGIGLATVKAIAEQYGASASCEYGKDSISFLVTFKKA